MSLTKESDEGWIDVPSSKRKTKTGQVLEKTRSSTGGGRQGPSLDSLKRRLTELDKKIDTGSLPPLGEGRLSDVHLTVRQLLYVKSDAQAALPFLEELETGLERARVARSEERRQSLTEKHQLGRAYDGLRIAARGSLPKDLLPQALQQAKAEFEKEPDERGALKLAAAFKDLSEQAKVFCEKWQQNNGDTLKNIVSDMKREPVTLREVVNETGSTFQDNMSKSKYLEAACGCPTLDELMGRVTACEELTKTQNLGPAYAAFELCQNRYFVDELQPSIAKLTESKATFESAPTEEAASQFMTARDRFAQQAEVHCKKWQPEHEKPLEEILSQETIPKQSRDLHKDLIKASEELKVSLSGKDPIKAAADCENVGGLMLAFAARNQFDELPRPIGKGIWQINATKIYTPTGPTEVPSTGFKAVCPGQDHVNRQIVEAKLAGKMPANPVVPVIVAKDGTLVLQDKHHTFVACMALGRPVKLALTSNPLSKVKKSWMECSWKGFEKPGAAAAGFSVPKRKSAALEGEATATDGWENIVPWRKDVPETDQGKVDKLVDGFEGVADSKAVKQELALACQDDPGLATKLYEVLKIGAVSVKVRKKPEKSTGGDWDAQENTVYVDDDLAPLDMVDMLIWESHNAIHQMDFSKTRHDAYRERKGPDEVGENLAKIEAKTEIEYLEHLIARSRKGSKISGNGKKHLDGIDKKFLEKELSPYSKMSEEDRKLHRKEIEQIFIDTPHDASKELPDRAALKSGEMYAYEHVADTQNVKGVKGYFRDKIPGGHPKKGAFLTALLDFKDSPAGDPKQPPKSWAGLFYDIVSQSANAIFGLSVPEFSAEQKQVAKAEATAAGATWEGTLRSALSQVGKLEIKVEATQEGSTAELSPAAKLYLEFKGRLQDAPVAKIKTKDETTWALTHGVEPVAVTKIRRTIQMAAENAEEIALGTGEPSDELFSQATEYFKRAIKSVEEFQKTLFTKKASSPQESEFRELLQRAEDVPLFWMDNAALQKWTSEGGHDLVQAKSLRDRFVKALDSAYLVFERDGLEASEKFNTASGLIEDPLEEYEDLVEVER